MSKAVKALGGKSAAAYSIDPKVPVIYGYDEEPPADGSSLVETDKARLKVDRALAANIAARGVIKPVVCRLVGEKIVLVDGRRRTIAARAANEMRVAQGLEPLPLRFVLELGGDETGALLTMVSANSFSREHSAIAQAEKAQAMLNAGLSHEDVANAFGFSRATLANRLKLLELPAPVRKHVASGALNPMTALELATEEPDEAVRIADELAAGGGPKKGQRTRAAAASKKEAAGDEHKPPSRAKLSKLLATEELAACSEEVQRVIRWVVGDLKTPNTIEGLAAAWKVASSGKKAPPREVEAAE